MITYSPQQQEALDKIAMHHGSNWFFLSGYAGTGKTEIAKSLYKGERMITFKPYDDSDYEVDEMVPRVQYGAYTGKAAAVMRSKGCIGAKTLHQMLYRAKEDPYTGKISFAFNPNSALNYVDMIVVDECSMCDQNIARDLLWFGKKLIVIGDPAQLPPVEGAGYFISRDPDHHLSEIHRQAAQNPIIHASMLVRQGQRIESMGDELRIMSEGRIEDEHLMEADQILVGTNKRRRSINRKVRKLMKLEGIVVPGEKLVCLRNNHRLGCYNGTTWEVITARESRERIYLPEDEIDCEITVWNLHIKSDDTKAETIVTVPEHFFTGTEDLLHWKIKNKFQQFTYGYALTVHKAQGSQWNNVLLFDESATFRDKRKEWLYTGLTRAAKNLIVVR